jgi:hypothetical protein
VVSEDRGVEHPPIDCWPGEIVRYRNFQQRKARSTRIDPAIEIFCLVRWLASRNVSFFTKAPAELRNPSWRLPIVADVELKSACGNVDVLPALVAFFSSQECATSAAGNVDSFDYFSLPLLLCELALYRCPCNPCRKQGTGRADKAGCETVVIVQDAPKPFWKLPATRASAAPLSEREHQKYQHQEAEEDEEVSGGFLKLSFHLPQSSSASREYRKNLHICELPHIGPARNMKRPYRQAQRDMEGMQNARIDAWNRRCGRDWPHLVGRRDV